MDPGNVHTCTSYLQCAAVFSCVAAVAACTPTISCHLEVMGAYYDHRNGGFEPLEIKLTIHSNIHGLVQMAEALSTWYTANNPDTLTNSPLYNLVQRRIAFSPCPIRAYNLMSLWRWKPWEHGQNMQISNNCCQQSYDSSNARQQEPWAHSHSEVSACRSGQLLVFGLFFLLHPNHRKVGKTQRCGRNGGCPVCTGLTVLQRESCVQAQPIAAKLTGMERESYIKLSL